ncbi:MAG: hypothetical protein P4L64_07965 [Caulobacteraceae bacterium]|nr:hypothetical protein [Caulobacteraceae bacterium]
MIATPCFGGLLTQGYVESIIKLIHFAGREGFDVHLAMLGHDALITRSRNTLVSAFLDLPEMTHLMFIDADIAFEPEAVGRLLAFDEDFVAGVYPLKVNDWNGGAARQRRYGESHALASLAYVGTFCEGAALERRDGFATAVYAGTGFMLIRRNVVESLAAAHPELRYRAAHVYPRPTRASEHQYALFECMIEPETGIYLSEDYAFCRRWLELGGRIWLDTESKLTHIGAQSFRGDTTLRLASELITV